MIRFRDGKPEAIWYSQHANGSAYAFTVVLKDASGKRVCSRPLSQPFGSGHGRKGMPCSRAYSILSKLQLR